jgi:hypothetical protein
MTAKLKRNSTRVCTKPKALDEIVLPPSPLRKRKSQPKKKAAQAEESGSEADGPEEAENHIEYAPNPHLITEILTENTLKLDR